MAVSITLYIVALEYFVHSDAIVKIKLRKML